MKTTFRFLITLSVIFLFSLPRPAYPIEISENETNKNILNLSGKIKRNDAEKLIEYFKNSQIPKMILIDSPGGDIVGAIRMSEIVNLLQLSVSVPKNKNCLSACFFIYLAGGGRTASGTIEGIRDSRMPTGFVGLHRPYLRSIDNTDDSQAAQHKIISKIKKYLEYQIVPGRLVDIMMSRPSNDIYWLTGDDIEEIGDYSPAQEELYIAKCDYDRRIYTQILAAKNSRNNVLHSMLQKQLSRSNQCIANLQNDSFDRGMLKITNGWVPQTDPLKNM